MSRIVTPHQFRPCGLQPPHRARRCGPLGWYVRPKNQQKMQHLVADSWSIKLRFSSKNSMKSFRVIILFGLPLLIAGALALATRPVCALPNEEHPPQRAWVYEDYADVVTGNIYPAAFLMSRKVVDVSAKTTGMGYGYLAVGNYSKRPMEVMLSWDEPPSRAGAANCKPSGCELTIRFGGAAAIKFIAVQDKHSPTLILQDGRAFVAEAIRHVGAIEVQVQTLGYGLVTHQFSTISRLQVEKLSRLKK